MAFLTMEETFIVTGIALVLFAIVCAILCSIFIKDPAAGYGPAENDEDEENNMGKPKMIGMNKPFVPNNKRNTFKKKNRKNVAKYNR